MRRKAYLAALGNRAYVLATHAGSAPNTVTLQICSGSFDRSVEQFVDKYGLNETIRIALTATERPVEKWYHDISFEEAKEVFSKWKRSRKQCTSTWEYIQQ
jgi:hypothetical protein